MPCIHGLDEINCPICRMNNYSNPKNSINNFDFNDNPLKPNNENFENLIKKENRLKDNINLKQNNLQPKLINPIISNLLFRDLPAFKNEMFIKRINEIDLGNPDKYNITKKFSLASAEWDIENYKKDQNKN